MNYDNNNIKSWGDTLYDLLNDKKKKIVDTFNIDLILTAINIK